MATTQTVRRRMKTALLTATFLTFAGSVFAQTCQSQATLNSVAQSTMSTQASEVPGGECSLFDTSGTGGTCYPIVLAPGDITPNSGGSVTDKFGNVWSLTGGGGWWAAPTMNGQQLAVGYIAAIRLLPSGQVALEEAKGAGWMVEPASGGNVSDVNNWDVAIGTSGWTFAGGDPGAGVGCGGTASTTTAADTSPPDPASAAPAAAAVQSMPTTTSAPAQSAAATVGQTCSAPVSGAITPGAGTLSDVNGDTFAINSTDNNTATINGEPITPNGESSQTGQMAVVDGSVYGQDENTLQWFQMVPGPGGERSWAWQPVESLPSAGQASVATTRWETAASGGQQACASAPPPAPSGQDCTPGPAQQDIATLCSDPSILATASGAAFCAPIPAALAMQAQTNGQLQQAGVIPIPATTADQVCAGAPQQ